MRTTFLCVTWRASSSSRLNRRSMSRGRRRVRADLRPDDLQRDGDAELVIPRLVDRAHAADAEQPDDVVAGTERLAGGERATAPARRRLGAGTECEAVAICVVLVAPRAPVGDWQGREHRQARFLARRSGRKVMLQSRAPAGVEGTSVVPSSSSVKRSTGKGVPHWPHDMAVADASARQRGQIISVSS